MEQHKVSFNSVISTIIIINKVSIICIIYFITCIFSTSSVINLIIIFSSCMLSHDARLRCDLVDLYYKLYGSKRPTCLPIPELAAIMKPPKHHDEPPKKKMHLDQPSTSSSNQMKQPPVAIKERTTDIIIEEENLDCVNVEVVSNVRVKVSYNNTNICFNGYFLKTIPIINIIFYVLYLL